LIKGLSYSALTHSNRDCCNWSRLCQSERADLDVWLPGPRAVWMPSHWWRNRRPKWCRIEVLLPNKY